jgi:hypothetical protein
MRTSMPSLFFFWALVGQSLLGRMPPIRRGRIWAVRSVLIALLLIGSYTSLTEIIRSGYSYHFGPPRIEDVRTIPKATLPRIVGMRVGSSDTFFFRLLSRGGEDVKK